MNPRSEVTARRGSATQGPRGPGRPPRAVPGLVLVAIAAATIGGIALGDLGRGAGADGARSAAGLLRLVAGVLCVALALAAGGFAVRATRRVDAAAREAERREQRFRDAAELTADWIWETDAEFRLRYLTDRVEEVTGCPKEALLGRTPWETDAEPVARGWPEVVNAMRGHERLEGLEYALTDASGRRRLFRISGKPVFSEDGVFLGYRGLGTDVTAERSTQEALEASGRRTQAILDRALDAVVMVDAGDRIIEYNAAAETIFGWSRDEAMGRVLAELLIPEGMRDRHLAGMQRFLRTGEQRMVGRRRELSALRSDGKEFPVELAITASTDGDSPVFTAFIRDIGPRKEAEAARRAAEERLWAFLDGSPEPVSMKDLDGRYVLCNSAFERMTGVPWEQLPGMTDDGVFPGEPALHEAIRRHEAQVIASRQPVRQQREWTGDDGRRRSFIVVKFPVLGAEGELAGVGTINQEVTELKNAEAQLRQAQKMQALGQLTGGVAHDFNNLLAVVLGNLELLEERLAAEPAAWDLATAAIAAARRGAGLTRRLLAFARQQPLAPQAVDLAALLQGMTDLLRQSLGDGVGLEIRCPADLRPCYADPAQLETALLNLAINARDAMPEGGSLVIEARGAEPGRGEPEAGPTDAPGADAASAGSARDGEEGNVAGPVGGPWVTLSVTDTGSGMAPETVERAFEPFFTTKPVGKGSGLGLSMVYGFVRQSGGQARIVSSPGRGTRIELTLPVAVEVAGARCDGSGASGG